MIPEGALRFFGSSPALHLLLAFAAVDLVKGSVLMLLASTAAGLYLRNHPSHARSLWLACLFALTVMPLCWLWLPPLRILPVPPGDPERGLPSATLRWIAAGDLPGMRNIAGVGTALTVFAARGVAPGVRALGRLVEGVWLIGAALGLARIAAGARRIRRLPVLPPDAEILSRAESIRRDLGIHRRVRIEMSSDCEIPFTHGTLRPRVVLPLNALAWAPDRATAVLLPELIHVRRMDAFLGRAANLLTAVLWFLPSSWIAARRLLQAQEDCADAEVLSRGIPAAEYARTLLEIGRSCSGRFLVPGPQRLFGRRQMLKRRIKGILELGSN